MITHERWVTVEEFFEIARLPENIDRHLELEAGTSLVWAVYPDEQIVHVVAPRRKWQKLDRDETLTGEDVLPGFALPVKDTFPAPSIP